MAQSKILIDSNAYFRLAQSIQPLLKTEFGEPPYCLYVIKELQDEYNRSRRLRNKFPWVNDSEYAQNRSHRLQISRKDGKEIEHTLEFMLDHKKTAYPGVSRVDVIILAHAYVLGVPVVTDDTDLRSLANDFEVITYSTLELLKLMLDSNHIDMSQIRGVAGYLIYQKDEPKNFQSDYKRLFGEGP